jgi:hypothetical protein
MIWRRLLADPRRFRVVRPARPVLLALGVAAVLMVSAGGCRRAPDRAVSADAEVTEIERLQRRTAGLERLVELAGGKEFYLVLDPGAAVLTLMLRGAELRRFGVLQQWVARPRVAWFVRSKAVPWQGVVWSDGALVPPRPLDRVVINADPQGPGGEEPEPPRIPPTAEELYRIPARYRIRFAGGLAVEIRPGEGDPIEGRLKRFGRWLVAHSVDAVAALGTSTHDEARLRLVLSRADAESLYRSLPPAVKLLVLIPDGPPDRRRATGTAEPKR